MENNSSAGKVKTAADPRLGHRKRLRMRFQKAGIDALAEHEILELLLSFAISRRDVKPYARSLIEKFGSTEAVMDANCSELTNEHGLGEASATLITLVKALCIKYLEQPLRRQDLFSRPEDVVKYLRMKLGGSRKETLAVLYLNQRNCLIACDTYSGTAGHALVYPNDIAERALLCHASGVIIAHNHPSGICSPSPEDIDATLKVRQTLGIIHIPLYEHLIVPPTAHICLLKKLDKAQCTSPPL